jgi:hypothetical protein
MANSIWQATVQNATGDIIPGAEMTVVDENTGLPATIFSSIGGAVLANPFFADSEGFAQFYAASGTYRVTANDTGTGQSITWRYIRFGDAASRDVGTTSGNVMEVGAFGWGSSDTPYLGATIDADTLTKIGITYGGFTNAPLAVTAWISVDASSSPSGRIKQTWMASTSELRYVRSQTSIGAWSDWEILYNSSNLDHLQNTSGGSVASNATIAGSNLTPAQSGIWLNASGASIANNGYGLWIKQ